MHGICCKPQTLQTLYIIVELYIVLNILIVFARKNITEV